MTDDRLTIEFATDPNSSVVLRFDRRVVVVTSWDLETFVTSLTRLSGPECTRILATRC